MTDLIDTLHHITGKLRDFTAELNAEWQVIPSLVLEIPDPATFYNIRHQIREAAAKDAAHYVLEDRGALKGDEYTFQFRGITIRLLCGARLHTAQGSIGVARNENVVHRTVGVPWKGRTDD